ERDVARIANDVEHLAVTVIEIFVALDDAGSGSGLEGAIRLGGSVGNELFDVGETDVLVGMNQIGDQETRPRVSRTRIGDDEGIVRIHGEISLRAVYPESIFHDNAESVDHGTNCSTNSCLGAALPESRCVLSKVTPKLHPIPQAWSSS